MEVLGRKETLAPGGARVVVDVTTWTLLGLCVDHFYKVWARHGAPAVLACDVHQNQKVNICNVVEKGGRKWPSPGVAKLFVVPAAVVNLALKLWGRSVASVREKGWRVFDGDVDMRTACGKPKGAVDGLAGKDGDMSCLALMVSLDVRRPLRNRFGLWGVKEYRPITMTPLRLKLIK